VVDPSRENVYENILENLRSINDNLKRNIKAKDSSDYYSEILRYENLAHRDIEKLLAQYAESYSEYSLASAAGNDTAAISRRLAELHNSIFNLIWVSQRNKSVVSIARQVVLSNQYGEILPLHIISALTLSLLGYYDKYKLSSLLDIYEAETSEKIVARALVGIVLALNRHPRRAMASKDIRERLETLEDSIMSYRRIREIVLSMIKTRDTDRISTKMQEEVLPEIMKIRPDVLRKMRDISPETLEDGIMENNPEWEELLDKSGLTEKMRELSDMQSDGADLMMGAFSNLKQFPFFNSASNWFLPFFANHPAIEAGEKERHIIERIMEIGRNVCDSDKYSLAIALGKMPEAQKNMMTAQLDAQFTQFSEEIKEKALTSSTPEFDEEVTKSLRDLYRFFKLFRKKEGFDDPFKKPFNFLDIPVIGHIMSDTEIVSLIGEFYFSRKYYTDALPLLNLLIEEAPEDSAIWEKIGYCYQSMKFYEKALEAYSHAELLKTPSIWLLKKIAFTYKKLGKYNDALEYYKKLLEKDPENLNLILNAGYCALKEGNPAEALKHYYHANYIDSDNINIFRAIAWAEFENRNFEKSKKYYDKILSVDPDPTDYLNIGHLYAISGDLKKALEFY
ncbi:MAG: tetratricopeptide repeat protein, partial [Muribaculaceae bacterium]|nr:tetratricopeptide repeat protein [Muribaculaceae bacterium]